MVVAFSITLLQSWFPLSPLFSICSYYISGVYNIFQSGGCPLFFLKLFSSNLQNVRVEQRSSDIIRGCGITASCLVLKSFLKDQYIKQIRNLKHLFYCLFFKKIGKNLDMASGYGGWGEGLALKSQVMHVIKGYEVSSYK